MDKKIEYKVTIENAESEKYAKAILEELKKLQKQGKSINWEKEENEYGERQGYSFNRREERDKRYDAVEVDYQKMQKFYELPIPRKENKVNVIAQEKEATNWGSKILNIISSFIPAKASATAATIQAFSPEGDAESILKNEKEPLIHKDEWKYGRKTLEMHDMEDDIDHIKEEIPRAIAAYEEQLAIYQQQMSEKLGEQVQTMPEFIKEVIDDNISEDSKWKFSEEALSYYDSYFKARRKQAEDNQEELAKIGEEEQEREKRLVEHSNQLQEQAAEQKRQRDQKLFEEEIADRIEAGKKLGNVEAQNADEILEAKMSATLELKGADDILAQNNKKIAESEKDNQKTRLTQWQEYAEKAAEISRKISEATGMVTSSLGGMFGQLGSYYSDQVQAFADKIAVLDEEKEAALERVALSEEERQAKEEEIAQQKIELEYATSDEQRAKADERIATLQGELSAEDIINREFGDKKAELEKEKAKKEAEQKKAEKMEKRLQMSQAIVEAIGDVAAGAAKALKYGPILGPIMAAIVSAAGAVQVGIMSKQLTKMKDGGLLRGLSHARGGMPILGSNVEVEGGEYVVNKQSTQNNLGLLEYINGERRGLGYMDMNTYFGEQSVPPSFLTQMMNEPSVVPQLPMKDSVDTQILNAIERINFQPRVSVTDINTVHDNMVKVDEWTGL